MRTIPVVVFSLLAAAAAAQTPHVDQSYVPSSLTNGLEVTANQPVTQTFTCGRDGQLLQVDVARIRHHNGISQNPLTIAIVATDPAGVPTANVLASVTLQPGSVPTSISPVSIDFSAFNVQVQNGLVLGLALTSPNAPGTPSYAWWGTAPGGAYAGGQIFIQASNIPLPVWDLAFETFVAPIASWSNYGAGHPGTLVVPLLSSTANPVVGTSPDLVFGNSVNVPAAAVLFLGLASANVPTPLGGTALVQPVTSFGYVLPPGGVLQSFPIPNDHLLCGLEIFAQGIVLDAGASVGFAFTPGLRYVLGD